MLTMSQSPDTHGMLAYGNMYGVFRHAAAECIGLDPHHTDTGTTGTTGTETRPSSTFHRQ
eukprot:m.55851 g.55851  ORF g.55851 m.55851 type:complete len:60 (-) comp16920_c0_seq6:297-476(-)